MTALPPPNEDLEKLWGSYPNAVSAYNVCRHFERNATTDDDRMCIRVLGYLIIHVPTPAALQELVNVIHTCRLEIKRLIDLGNLFVHYFVRSFKKFKGRTPATSEHPSRPSFAQIKSELKERIREAPRDHTDAKRQALIRDGFQCVVTRLYDRAAEEYSTVDLETILRQGGSVRTECAHIVPESTYFNVSNTPTSTPAKKEYAASVLAVLYCFGYNVDNLNGPKVHSLYNVMTLEKNVHDAFDRLEVWFEKAKGDNCYNVETFVKSIVLHNKKVTFTSPDTTTLPLPSSELLALHAACAKVAHLSGAGEYVDRLDRDEEDTRVLDPDGSSGPVLDHALLSRMGSIGVGA